MGTLRAARARRLAVAVLVARRNGSSAGLPLRYGTDSAWCWQHLWHPIARASRRRYGVS
jgi:hypothetical protein